MTHGERDDITFISCIHCLLLTFHKEHVSVIAVVYWFVAVFTLFCRNYQYFPRAIICVIWVNLRIQYLPGRATIEFVSG